MTDYVLSYDRMADMNILILCHGHRHTLPTHKPYSLCGTSGLTYQTIASGEYHTLDNDPRCDPDITHDITKPLEPIAMKYDIVTNMHAPYDIYMDYHTGAIKHTTFENAKKLLHDGGYFVVSIADGGIHAIMVRNGLFTRRARRNFYDLDPKTYYYRSMRSMATRYFSRAVMYEHPEFTVLTPRQKMQSIHRWNDSKKMLHDEHDLLIFQYTDLSIDHNGIQNDGNGCS